MTNHISSTIVSRIDQKKARLQALRPLPQSAVRKLQEKFEIEMTYNSNAIEGNSLTLKETFLVINEGITIKGKPLKDHLEAKDHHEALEMVYELVSQDAQPTISEHLIRTLHQLVVKKTEEDIAGKYRTSNVFIAGASHTPPDALQVTGKMRQLIQWYAKYGRCLHPVELAALTHHKLVHIHPFLDGNGRTARLVMNVVLLREGYPLAVILKNDRRKYYRALHLADNGELDLLVRMIAQAVERSLNIYLDTLTPSSNKKEKHLKLADVATEVPYSAKYLNLLVRQGKLEAYKLSRDWLTSVEAVQRYVSDRERQRQLS